MKAFVITVVVLLLLASGRQFATKPRSIRTEPSAGVLFFGAVTNLALAIWGLSIII